MDKVDTTQDDATRIRKPTPSNTIANDRKIKKAEANPDNKGAAPWLNITKSYCWRRARVSCRRTKCHDRIIAGATVIIALVGIGQFIIYFQMKKIMQSSSTQTDQLICAAKIQAQAATQNADSAKSIARSTEIQTQRMTTLAQQAALANGVAVLRPANWMALYWEDDRAYAKIAIINRGRSEADSIQVAANVAFRTSKPAQNEYSFATDVFMPPDKLRLPAYSSKLPIWLYPTRERTNEVSIISIFMDQHVSQTEAFRYKTGAKTGTMYVWGQIRYKIFTGEWADDVPFCRFIDASEVFRQPENGGRTVDRDCETKK